MTRPSATPRPYSTGTSARKRRNCPARRISSSRESGAARNPCERALDRPARPDVNGRVGGERRRHEPVEVGAHARGRRGTVLPAEGLLEHSEVAAGERALRCEAGREAAFERLVGGLERAAQAGLVGVEVIGADPASACVRVLRPSASEATASVASAPGREKRVGGRNSRTSSHCLASATWPALEAPQDSPVSALREPPSVASRAPPPSAPRHRSATATSTSRKAARSRPRAGAR